MESSSLSSLFWSTSKTLTLVLEFATEPFVQLTQPKLTYQCWSVLVHRMGRQSNQVQGNMPHILASLQGHIPSQYAEWSPFQDGTMDLLCKGILICIIFTTRSCLYDVDVRMDIVV
ncbi:hypothetical protein IFM89_003637 [Coptis chinensis]|uniref:Uncharacterized protein n=1 Tax=Coptis chinensis TaxID=261450 RepID=A0A835IR85_9MAGN|nr:hypothetical protein IFM89_003637 [Coptis chinensis]